MVGTLEHYASLLKRITDKRLRRGRARPLNLRRGRNSCPARPARLGVVEGAA